MEIGVNVDSNSESLTSFQMYDYFVNEPKEHNFPDKTNPNDEALKPTENDDGSPLLPAYPRRFRYSDNGNLDGSSFYAIKEDFNALPAAKEDPENVDTKHSTVPILANSFLTMENSNNATDNNICTSASINNVVSLTASEQDSNPVFKLPNNELTFNGTLKHLQKLKPIVNTEAASQSRCEDNFKFVFINEGNRESSDGCNGRSSSPGGDSKSVDRMTVSSNSQYPSDCDVFLTNVLSRTPSGLSTTAETSQGLNGSSAAAPNLSFAGTLSPLKQKTSADGDKSNYYSLDFTYDTGVCSPLLFSDNEDEIFSMQSMQSTEEKSSREFAEFEKKFAKRLEKTLQGVPPPPSITISQITATEMLNLYNANLSKYNCLESPSKSTLNSSDSVDKTVITNSSEKSLKTEDGNNSSLFDISNKLLSINTTEELVIKEEWPKMLSLRYYDIFYNRSTQSEEIDCLLSRYLLRYIGCETASSCIAFPLKRSPAKKSLRSNIGRSPGRRLSHLARRKITFCNADTIREKFASKKQILVDRTKYSGLTAGRTQTLRRSPRKKITPKKLTPLKRTPKTKTPRKKTPNSSQNKRVARQVPISIKTDIIPKSQPTKESSKRALFLSPDNVKPNPTEDISTNPSTSKILRSKRALFNTPTKKSDNSKNVSTETLSNSLCDESVTDKVMTRKRSRLEDAMSESECAKRVKLHKSLSFGGDKIESSSQDYSASLAKHNSEHLVNKNSILSDLHKKKLLWAVAEALRCHGIGVKHDNFRLHMSSLARLTRKISQLPQCSRVLRTPGTSTSETLLRIAHLHAFAVIRGEPIDDIFTKEQNKQMNPQSTKLVGYIPLNGCEQQDKQSHFMSKNNENSYDNDKYSKVHNINDVKTVLQDKTINLNPKINDSNNKLSTTEIKKTFLSKDNSKMRACRQISFEMDCFKR